jgi:chromate reductase
MRTTILAFSGSSRRESQNQKLLDRAVVGACEAGAEVTRIRLLDYELPIYDGDWEAEHGVPSNAQILQELFGAHDGLLIATPEQNGGYTALLKNVLDWVSRPKEEKPFSLSYIANKSAALVSASAGHLGGIGSQLALQFVLVKLGVHINPVSFALGAAQHAFDAQGCLKDPHVDTIVRDVGASLVHNTAAFQIGARISSKRQIRPMPR